MHIRVDEALCQGHGRCYTLAPALLDGDDAGFVTIRGSSLEVPAGLEGTARNACNACPEDAISLVEARDG